MVAVQDGMNVVRNPGHAGRAKLATSVALGLGSAITLSIILNELNKSRAGIVETPGACLKRVVSGLCRMGQAGPRRRREATCGFYQFSLVYAMNSVPYVDGVAVEFGTITGPGTVTSNTLDIHLVDDRPGGHRVHRCVAVRL